MIELDTGVFYSHHLNLVSPSDDSLSEEDDYSGLELALFVACKTGAGGEGGNNLPSAIVEYGAEAAVGFEENIGCGSAGVWTDTFVSCLLEGYTAREALEEAEYMSGISCSVLCGNDYYTLED